MNAYTIDSKINDRWIGFVGWFVWIAFGCGYQIRMHHANLFVLHWFTILNTMVNYLNEETHC